MDLGKHFGLKGVEVGAVQLAPACDLDRYPGIACMGFASTTQHPIRMVTKSSK